MGHPLIDLFLAHTNGREIAPHRPAAPPHLAEIRWRYACDCGYSWTFTGSAVWRDEQWQSPKRECVGCHRWQTGSPQIS